MSPTYEYKCEKCLIFCDVTKPMRDSDSTEKCPKCKRRKMTRMISVPRLNTSVCTFEPDYYHAFGKKLHSKREVKEELRRIKGETGKEIVEVGNDSLKSIKKRRKAYTLD